MANKAEENKDDITCAIKETVEKVKKSFKDKKLVSDASYELGRSFKIAKNTCVEIFNDLME